MRIRPKELLFGQPTLQIRKVLRLSMDDNYFTTKKDLFEAVSKLLDQSLEKTKEILKQLVEADYLRLKNNNKNHSWQIIETEKGRRLGVTNANPPISREKAELLLKELLERAVEINNAEFAFKIVHIKVFGSFLSDQVLLGDLDIAFKLRKIEPLDKFQTISDERIKLAGKNGKQFANSLQQAFWSRTEVIQMLKTKKKGLSLHDEDSDQVIGQTNWRFVYEYEQ